MFVVPNLTLYRSGQREEDREHLWLQTWAPGHGRKKCLVHTMRSLSNMEGNFY